MIPKFKAWHKMFEEIGQVKRIRFDDDGNVSTVLFKGKDFGINETIDKIVLMQSTGLKDKNGKEIFEGDIVTDGDVTSDIKYHQTLGFYMIGKYGFSVPFGQGVDVEYFEEFADHVSKIFEVIGNIYENPELLEVE